MKMNENLASGQNGKMVEPSAKTYTLEQLDANHCFRIKMEFFRSIIDVLEIGFQNAEHRNPVQEAMKYNPDIIGTLSHPYTIDFAKVVISKGDLTNPRLTEAIFSQEGRIDICWFFDEINENRDDKINLLMYSEAGEIFIMNGLLRREDLGFTIYLTMHAINVRTHIWVFLCSADDDMVSDSIYLGNIGSQNQVNVNY